MKTLLAFTLALLVVASAVEATINGADKFLGNGVTVGIITTPSQAQNAIDTTTVAITDAVWTTTSASAGGIPISITHVGAAGVDSVNIGVDVSMDGSNWVELYSLANTGSNPTEATPYVTVYLTLQGRYARLRVKNVDATTGISTIGFAYPRAR